MDRYLSLPSASELAGVCRNTMKRYIRDGHVQAERLPSEKGRGPWRIAESSVVALLEGSLKQRALDHLRRLRA